MTTDMFGNLREWGRVLERLEGLRESGQLDDHQAGLARILRYKDNWRLRETVLEYIEDLDNPTEELLQEVSHIMMDDGLYYDARILLAARAVTTLIVLRENDGKEVKGLNRTGVMEKMDSLMGTPQPPKLTDTIRQSLEALRG